MRRGRSLSALPTDGNHFLLFTEGQEVYHTNRLLDGVVAGFGLIEDAAGLGIVILMTGKLLAYNLVLVETGTLGWIRPTVQRAPALHLSPDRVVPGIKRNHMAMRYYLCGSKGVREFFFYGDWIVKKGAAKCSDL